MTVLVNLHLAGVDDRVGLVGAVLRVLVAGREGLDGFFKAREKNRKEPSEEGGSLTHWPQASGAFLGSAEHPPPAGQPVYI